MKKLIFFLLCLLFAGHAFAEIVVLDNGRVIEGRIFEVTDEYIRMFVDGEIMKLRFRNMDIDSAEKYYDYEPEPYIPPVNPESELEAPSKTYRDFTKEGLGFAEEGKFKEAVESFSRAIEMRNDVPDIYMFRAGTYQQWGELDKAIKDYTWLTVRQPDNWEFFARRGWIYQEQGKTQKAINDYSRVLELDPYNFEILMERYNLYKSTEQWWKAREDIDYIIALNPDEGEVYLDQAFLNYRVGSYYNAWQSVYEAGKKKAAVPPGFIEKLKERMADPFLQKKPEEPESFLEKARKIIVEYIGFLIVAVLAAVLGMIILVLPSKKHKVDYLKQAVEEEENLLRMVSFHRASFGKRLCAGVIDLIVLSILSWAIQLMTAFDVFAAVLGVMFLLRDSFGGVSIGKGMTGLRVIDEHGYRGIFFQGLIRNFTFALPVILFYVLFWGAQFRVDVTARITLAIVCFFFILEGVIILFSKKEGRRIGDRMAGTFVHDLRPSWWRWPFVILSVVLFVGYLAGTVTLNMGFNKAFLYRLNPLRYYNIEREFSFQFPKGWKMASEGEGGLVLEKPSVEGSMVLVFNEEAKEYALDLCVTAFTQSMKDGGLDLRTNEEIEVAGRRAFKVGFLEKETQSGILVVYFKKEDWGELYMLQVSSPKKSMRYIMADAMDMVKGFRFE